MRKENRSVARLIKGFGIENDAHGGKWHRQGSFLAQESIDFMREKGLDVVAGNFAENITTEGLDLVPLGVGKHLQIGEAEIVLSQLGKICHNRCAIYHQAGDCVMPREGVFGVVLEGGEIKTGDQIEILAETSRSAAIIAAADDEKLYGEQIREYVCAKWNPAFIRFDSLSDKNSNFEAILKDLTDTQPYPDGQEIIRPLSNPIKKDSHLVIMRGNLAPEGAVAKITGKEGERFSGTARVFESEEKALAAILGDGVGAGDVVVIRNEGPKGGPGMLPIGSTYRSCIMRHRPWNVRSSRHCACFDVRGKSRVWIVYWVGLDAVCLHLRSSRHWRPTWMNTTNCLIGRGLRHE